ncbi:MAG: copper amine oxidase N-terminal domain-containing protein [Clostridiales bacterium]|nr:copper amine oxidase N-terminal domain-containing protein [Clostridiales bacterium]
MTAVHMCRMLLICILCCSLLSCSGGVNEDLFAISDSPYFEGMPDFSYTAEREHKEVQIVGNRSSRYSFDGLQPYFDQTGATMFPMVHFDELFTSQESYEIDGDKVTITKNILGVETVVSVTAGSNVLLRDGQEIAMATTPVKKDGTIYIPLEFVGRALSCGVGWWSSDNEVHFSPYTSICVYVWNEKENSSLRGLRYSYTISGDYTVDMPRIAANATPSYRKVRSVINNLPQNANVTTTLLYRIKGYVVPYTVFDHVIDDVYEAGLISSYNEYCLDEIPPIIKDFDDFVNDWYSLELCAIDEEAIYDSPGHVYRFSFFPAFTDQIVVRMEISDKGTADAYIKVSKGVASGHGGGISRSKKAKMNKAETDEFLELLKKNDYWNLPAEEIKLFVLDGHNFVVEGVKDGTYHIVDRCTPEEGEDVYGLQEYFFNLLKQKFRIQVRK